MFGRVGGQALRCAARRPFARRKLCDRRFSAQTGVNNTAASAPSPLGGITVELDRIAPRFEIPASQITILDSPANFYIALKVSSLRGVYLSLQVEIDARLPRTKSETLSGAFTFPLCTLARPSTSLSRRYPTPYATILISKYPSSRMRCEEPEKPPIRPALRYFVRWCQNMDRIG